MVNYDKFVPGRIKRTSIVTEGSSANWAIKPTQQCGLPLFLLDGRICRIISKSTAYSAQGCGGNLIISCICKYFDVNSSRSILMYVLLQTRTLFCSNCLTIVGVINEIVFEDVYRTKQVRNIVEMFESGKHGKIAIASQFRFATTYVMIYLVTRPRRVLRANNGWIVIWRKYVNVHNAEALSLQTYFLNKCKYFQIQYKLNNNWSPSAICEDFKLCSWILRTQMLKNICTVKPLVQTKPSTISMYNRG